MSYIDAMHDKTSETIKVLERTNGQRRIREYQIEYSFYVEDPKGRFLSLYGDRISKVTCKSKTSFAKEIAACRNKKTFETDLNLLFKCLAENYLHKELPELHVAFFDIETDMQPYAYPSSHKVKIRSKLSNEIKEIIVFQLARLPNAYDYEVYDDTLLAWTEIRKSRYLEGGPGYASPDDAFMPITAISIYLQWLDELICLAVPPKTLSIDEAYELIKEFPNTILFNTDSELLTYFIDILQDVDVISGWNSEAYDVPYVVNRIMRVLSKDATRKLSAFNELPKKREYVRYGKKSYTYDFVGLVHLDSLALYRKYTYEERHSFTLDAIAEYELNERKVPYEGTLDQLYNTDFKKFIDYNRQDSALLSKLDKKLKFIELANAIAHENTVLLSTVLGTVAVTDQAIINEAHRLGLAVPSKKRDYQNDEEEISAAGAYVAYPTKGLFDWVGSLDINSLYPSTIRALNMCIETVVGQLRPVLTDEYLLAQLKKDNNAAAAWEGLFGSLEYTAVMNKEIGTNIVVDWENGKSDIMSAAEIYRLIFESNTPWMLSANGTIFTYEKEGVIPGLLSKWYSDRREMQAELKAVEDLKYGIKIDNELMRLLSNG